MRGGSKSVREKRYLTALFLSCSGLRGYDDGVLYCAWLLPGSYPHPDPYRGGDRWCVAALSPGRPKADVRVQQARPTPFLCRS